MQRSVTMRRGASSSGASAPLRASRRGAVSVRAGKALIVNTKGGGHAFIGYYLAKELKAKGHSVTIMNDGDKEKVSKKAPYSHYDELTRDGIQVCWGNPRDPKTYPGGTFDIVYDNNGKDMESCQPVIDTFRHTVKHYVFVASAGAYKADPIEPMHMEGDARKSTAGHVQVEQYLAARGVPATVFQPLYIYGPLTNKDCEQWFVDRIVRDRPVLIPAPGIQLTTLTHVEDVASMLAAVPGNRAAVGQHYNAIGKALGKEPQVVLYDPSAIGTGKSGKADGFPFRTIHFFASSDKAKRELGWQPKHDFLGDAEACVRDYLASGRQNQDIDFSTDTKIMQLMVEHGMATA